ncbi:MAG: hypothetical protein IJS09_04725, partial [Treponema sp.]|nr:hypothetical protein [Treponema sp.]
EREERKKVRKEMEKARKADAARHKRERTDKYLGVVYTPESRVDLKSGKVHVVLSGNHASFNIYAVSENGRETPILATTDGFRSSFFSLLIGRREYRLNRAGIVSSQIRKREDGAQIAYRIEKNLQITLDFSTLASVAGEPDDIVKITVYTTNFMKNRQVLALRAVLDTMLGESLDYHFVTATGQKIDSERQFVLFDDERYFVSTNTKTSAQFLTNGKTVDVPQTVSFANKDVLADSMWTPVIRDTRGFNTALSYNNSAMCINWPYYSVEPGETAALTFYICIGTDGEEPKGQQFVDSLVDETRVIETFAGSAELSVRKPDVDFVVAPITENQLDPEYIQKLIDRINSLNSDPKLVDRTEVRQLNAELDAILERLRRMNQ